MSRKRPQLVMFVCAVLAVPAWAAHEGIQWQQDLEAAKAAAKQSGRLVLVHFWAPTCQPCLALEQNVFNQPGVAGALEAQFVPVKLNANEHVAAAQGFGITRVPTDVIITPEGQVVGKLVSPPMPGAYVAELSQVAREHVSRAGQSFGVMSELAPVVPKLNAAYVNLQVAPNVAPAIPLQSQNAAPAQSALAPPPLASASTLNAPQAPTMSTMAGTQHPSSSSTTASNVPVAQPAPSAVIANDRYAQAGLSNMPAASPVPTQTVNPYVTQASPPLAPQMQAPPLSMQPAAAPAASPDSRALPPNSPPIGFDGYCPVSMRTQWKWVPGDPRWGIVHRGRTYWFAGPAEQQQFWADPDRYSPAFSGMDPVMAIDHQQQVPGKREHSIDYDNMFYMFASEATLQQFTATPERYAAIVRQAMGIPRGRLVR